MALGSVLKSWSATDIVDMAFDGQYLWLARYTGNKVLCCNREGVEIKNFTADWMVANTLWGIAFDGHCLWLIEGLSGGGKLHCVNRDGVLLKTFSSPTDALYLAFDGSNFWTTESTAHARNNIYLMTKEGVQIKKLTWVGSGWCQSLTFDGQRLWITENGGEKKIWCLTRDGVALKTISSPSNDPYGLTFDGQYLWYSDIVTGLVYMLSRV